MQCTFATWIRAEKGLGEPQDVGETRHHCANLMLALTRLFSLMKQEQFETDKQFKEPRSRRALKSKLRKIPTAFYFSVVWTGKVRNTFVHVFYPYHMLGKRERILYLRVFGFAIFQTWQLWTIRCSLHFKLLAPTHYLLQHAQLAFSRRSDSLGHVDAVLRCVLL